MKVVLSEQEFSLIEGIKNTFLSERKKFPDNIFKIHGKYLFIEFNSLINYHFYERYCKFSSEVKECCFFITTLDPDPRNYFFKNFNLFASFEFSVEDTENDFRSALTNYPAESPADAMLFNTNYLMLSSYSGRWAIVGDRYSDIAVCAFTNHEVRLIFEQMFRDVLINNADDASVLLNIFDFNDEARRNFIKNYSQK